MNMNIKILLPEEQKYTYTQSRQIMAQTGCIGHLRADLGSGEAFYSSWDDHRGDLKTPEFKRELDEVINALRFGPMYIDRNDCIIQDGDELLYDDGAMEKVFTLEDGSKGYSITSRDYLEEHPDADERFVSLIGSDAGAGLYKLNHAIIKGLEDPEERRNTAGCGAILSNRSMLARFCHTHLESGFGNDREWGIRVNTSQYAYLMRLNPNKGEYSLYCYSYRRDWLDHHLEQARRGIRFITPSYEEKFRIPDGDRVRISYPDGDIRDRTARYIDDYHVEIGGVGNTSLYHICELAEALEAGGGRVIPLRSSLPERCFVYVKSTDEIGVVIRGEMGYRPAERKLEGLTGQKGADYLNDARGITPAQAAAMNAGSLFGWDTKVADPANYDEEGRLKRIGKDRGGAR